MSLEFPASSFEQFGEDRLDTIYASLAVHCLGRLAERSSLTPKMQERHDYMLGYLARLAEPGRAMLEQWLDDRGLLVIARQIDLAASRLVEAVTGDYFIELDDEINL